MIHAGSWKAKLHSILNVYIMDDWPWVTPCNPAELCTTYATFSQGFPEEERKTQSLTHIHAPSSQLTVAAFIMERKEYTKMI